MPNINEALTHAKSTMRLALQDVIGRDPLPAKLEEALGHFAEAKRAGKGERVAEVAVKTELNNFAGEVGHKQTLNAAFTAFKTALEEAMGLARKL